MGFPKSICVLVCCLLAVWSCKKPEDLTPPTLVVHTPTDGTHYNALDTIIIDLDVSDNNVVQTVSVELITQNSALALPGKSIVVCADNDHLVFQYPLNEIHLESGQHYLRITASDGRQTKSAFVEIQLSEVPLRVQAACWLESPTDFRHGVWPGEEWGNITLPEPMQHLYPDRWDRRVICTHADGESMCFLDLDQGTFIESVSTTHPGPALGTFDLHTRRYNHLSADGWLQQYKSSGQVSGGFQVPGTWTYHALATTEDRIVVSGTSGSISTVMFFHKNSGALIQSITSPDPVYHLVTSDSFVGGISETQVFLWNAIGESLMEEDVPWTETVVHSAPFDPQRVNWLLQTESGNVWRLDLPGLSSVELNPQSNHAWLAPDWSGNSGIWYGAAATGIDVLTTVGSEAWVPGSGQALDLTVLLNK